MRHTKAVITALALTAAPALALAQTADTSGGLSMVEVIQQLESDGYTAIDEVERERDVLDITATDPEGNRVEIEVDASSGDILRSEPED